jgi:hypothetical protein
MVGLRLARFLRVGDALGRSECIGLRIVALKNCSRRKRHPEGDW